MEFIELTKTDTKKPVYVALSAITAVTTHDWETKVYIIGDSIPFSVKESVDDVMGRLRRR